MDAMQNVRVVDISHHNTVRPDGFKKAAAAGIWGVILKATQGTGMVDKTFQDRAQRALDAGLLVGAYHFNTGENVADQIDHFFDTVQPDANTLMALDYEDNRASNMSIHQVVEFLHRGEDKLGRKLALYSGNRLKETIGNLSDSDQEYVCSHKLWLCQYGPKAVLPDGFDNYWLWQFTGDGVGPRPHWVDGIECTGNNGIDLNRYDGTIEQLKQDWTS